MSCIAADQLSAALKKDKQVRIYIESHCETLPDVKSYNVIGQINGTEQPMHLSLPVVTSDSWDNGQGAHDDGAGVVQSIEILAGWKQSGKRPRHSIRAVAFMNEKMSRRWHCLSKFASLNKEKHLAALETDAGGFVPRSIGVDTTQGLYNKITKWKGLFAPYLLNTSLQRRRRCRSEGPAKKRTPCIGFDPDAQRYFDIHHTAADTFDKSKQART